MCLRPGFTSESVWIGGVMLGLSSFVFFSATLGILMAMDLLECCLHTLRLHWVEFQSKFFKGGGRQYMPVKL
jgi:V-type H+-transporting ATPase subunit a